MDEQRQQKEERLKELRQRVDDKAEKMTKSWFMSNILGSLSIMALVIVLPKLNNFFDWVETDWTRLSIDIFVIAIGAVFVLLLLKHFLNKIKCADTVSQQYKAAKQYIRTIQWGHFLLLLLPFLIVDSIKEADIGFSVFTFCVFLFSYNV